MRLWVLLALALSGCAGASSVSSLRERVATNEYALARERLYREAICQRFEEYQKAKEGHVTHPCRPGQSVAVDVQPIKVFGSLQGR